MVQEFSFIKIRRVAHQISTAVQQGNPRHLGNNRTDGTAEGSNRHVVIAKDVVQLQAVSLNEGTVKYWSRNFESDEVMEAIRGVAVFCNLHHVETEFSANVGLVIVGISDLVAIFLSELREFNGDNLIYCRVAHIV